MSDHTPTRILKAYLKRDTHRVAIVQAVMDSWPENSTEHINAKAQLASRTRSIQKWKAILYDRTL